MEFDLDKKGSRFLCRALTNRRPRKLEARGDSKESRLTHDVTDLEIFHFKIGLRHLIHLSRKSHMLHGMISIWLPYCIYDWIQALSCNWKWSLICDWINICNFYKILHHRRCAMICQNGAGSGLQHWVDSGPIVAQCDLCTWIWLNQYHIFLTMPTHKSRTCDTFVTRNWPIDPLKIYRYGEKRYCLSTREYLNPYSWKWAIGRRTGWPWFVKSPLAHDVVLTIWTR